MEFFLNACEQVRKLLEDWRALSSEASEEKRLIARELASIEKGTYENVLTKGEMNLVRDILKIAETQND